MGVERRQFTRVPPCEHASAALGQALPTVGRITDISQGGLSFEYIPNGEAITPALPTIDIFLLDDDFYLSDVACRIIYDMPVQREGGSFTLGLHLETRRCGVRFHDVDGDRAQQLQQFLQRHTTLYRSYVEPTAV
jgi:c-di-GMP-binding flagellar brake protein YcgR